MVARVSFATTSDLQWGVWGSVEEWMGTCGMCPSFFRGSLDKLSLMGLHGMCTVAFRTVCVCPQVCVWAACANLRLPDCISPFWPPVGSHSSDQDPMRALRTLSPSWMVRLLTSPVIVMTFWYVYSERTYFFWTFSNFSFSSAKTLSLDTIFMLIFCPFSTQLPLLSLHFLSPYACFTYCQGHSAT